MQHSKYCLCGLWDVPETVTSPVAIRWDMNGKPIKFTCQPSFIASHKTAPGSLAEGYVICCRIFDAPELN